jgi:hypothetical protein
MDPTYEELLKERNALREENNKMMSLLNECRDAITKISNEDKEKEVKANSQQMISQLGLGMDSDKLFMMAYDIISKDTNDETKMTNVLESASFFLELKIFTEYYNSKSKSKIQTQIVEKYKDFRINHVNKLSKDEFDDLMTKNIFCQSNLLWNADEEKLNLLYSHLKKKNITTDSDFIFKNHFNGYYLLGPALTFKDFGPLDIIYLFQELEFRNLITGGFMRNYAHNLELHTAIKRANFKKAKSQSGSSVFYIKDKFQRALENCPKAMIINEILDF